MIKFAALIAGAYLLGSVPFGLIIAAAHKIDLRRIGSGNIGATNLARALGRKWGYVCFALDAGKGLVPMLVAAALRSPNAGAGELALSLAVGCAAILGHIFPVYLRFKGGKGVATSFGVALGLWPYYTVCSLVSLAVWVVVLLLWRYVSLASMVSSLAFPVSLLVAIRMVPQWRFATLWPLLVVAAALPFLMVLRHRENIRRLLAGTESKVFGG